MFPHEKLSLATRQQSGRTHMDDEIYETVWRIRVGATLFIHVHVPEADGRVVALLTSRQGKGMMRCNEVTAPLKYSKVN